MACQKHGLSIKWKRKQQTVGARRKEIRSAKWLTVLEKAKGIHENESFFKYIEKRDTAPESQPANGEGENNPC